MNAKRLRYQFQTDLSWEQCLKAARHRGLLAATNFALDSLHPARQMYSRGGAFRKIGVYAVWRGALRQ
jgi:hypothetical protein